MNNVFLWLGLETWKPVLAALLLPPVPFIVLVLVGARMILWRRGWGWLTLLLAVGGLWLGHCMAVAEWLERAALPPVAALRADDIARLKADVTARRKVAIVVLGGGREALAPEYGVSNLTVWSMERLRYGVWLARETGAPLGFAGGSGHAQPDGPAEAEIAARIAAREFGRPLAWTEAESRDTRENAARTVALLRAERIETLVLVTHGWHLPRARRAFEDALAREGSPARVIGAPMGQARDTSLPFLRWTPSSEGLTRTRQVLRERLGLWLGA